MKKVQISDFTQYHNDLKKYLLTILKNENEINDIIQDVYVKIHILLTKDKIHKKNLKSLFFTIGKNELLSKLKKDIKFINFDNVIDDNIIDNQENYNSYFDDFLNYINTSNELNIILIKEQIQGSTIKQLSIKHNLSENSIKARLFNTKKKIKNKYNKIL